MKSTVSWVFEDLNPIPTGLGHVTLIYGLIPPMAGRNRVKLRFSEKATNI